MASLISFKMVGWKAFQKGMANRAKKLKDRRKMYARGVVYLDRWIQDNFRSQGGKVGGWKPLARTTIEGRRTGKKKRPQLLSTPGGWKQLATSGKIAKKQPQILSDIGYLKGHWKHLWRHDAGMIQSGVDYGYFHQEGTKRLPQRRILPKKSEVRANMKKIFNNYIKEALGK